MIDGVQFGYNYPNMNNYNPLEVYINKINMLEQRVNVLEKKVKDLYNASSQNTSFDYKTSMHMM